MKVNPGWALFGIALFFLNMIYVLDSVRISREPKANHPEGSEMHPVYLKGSKLYMDHKLFLRAVQCARTPDACQDVEQLDYPAETVLGGRK